MTPDEATKILTSRSEEIEAALKDIDSAQTQLNKAEPCGAKPSHEWAHALGDLVFGMSRGMSSLLRDRKAEIAAAIAALGEIRATRRGLLNAALGHGVRLAIIMAAIGFFTLAVRAKSILLLVKELFP